MTSPRENRPAVLAAVLAQALPGAAPHRIAEAVTAMTAAAKAHKRAAEHECNYPTDEAWQGRTAARLSGVVRGAEQAMLICSGRPLIVGPNYITTVSDNDSADYRHIHIKFGGDPRGPCGVLFVSDRDGDSWDEHNGRRGWAIYE